MGRSENQNVKIMSKLGVIGISKIMGVNTPSELIGTLFLFHAVALDICLESCRRKPTCLQIYVSRRLSATLFIIYLLLFRNTGENVYLIFIFEKTNVLAAPGLSSRCSMAPDWMEEFCRLRTGIAKLGGSTLQSMTRDAAPGGQTPLQNLDSLAVSS